MAKEIKFKVKLNIDGKEQLVTASTSTKELARNLDSARSGAAKLQDALVKFASLSTIVNNVGNVVSGLSQRMGDLVRQNVALQQQTGLSGDAMSKMRAEV